MGPRRVGLGLALACAAMLACLKPDPPDVPEDPEVELRVYHDPYAEVRWDVDRRLRTQFHDHTKDSPALLDPYDEAGYHVMPLFQYSGIPDLPAAWTELHWPPEEFLPPGYIEKLGSIERFFPNVELAPQWHLTTPFMEDYIERWDPALHPVKQEHQFETTQEAIDLIEQRGGYPVLAHPWSSPSNFVGLTGLHAIEIYSAFGKMNHVTQVTQTDPNEWMLRVWDTLLERDPYVLGLAVNDWHGPQCVVDNCIAHPEVVDSGKVELLAPSSSAEDVERAFARGALLAIRDLGLTKGAVPQVKAIRADEAVIEIDCDGQVIWTSHGKEVGRGSRFELDRLGANARYVRAEIAGPDGSRVWVQPFVVAPVGDIDGDGKVDQADELACVGIREGAEAPPDQVRAALASDCFSSLW
jgi:hypothetical protein